jgi:hypothetical protein
MLVRADFILILAEKLAASQNLLSQSLSSKIRDTSDIRGIKESRPQAVNFPRTNLILIGTGQWFQMPTFRQRSGSKSSCCSL